MENPIRFFYEVHIFPIPSCNLFIWRILQDLFIFLNWTWFKICLFRLYRKEQGEIVNICKISYKINEDEVKHLTWKHTKKIFSTATSCTHWSPKTLQQKVTNSVICLSLYITNIIHNSLNSQIKKKKNPLISLNLFLPFPG